MIGGRIIENAAIKLENGQWARRLWCVDRNGDECCVFAEDAAVGLNMGDQIWWQGKRIYAKNDTLILDKIGYSFNPQRAGLTA